MELEKRAVLWVCILLLASSFENYFILQKERTSLTLTSLELSLASFNSNSRRSTCLISFLARESDSSLSNSKVVLILTQSSRTY